MDLLELTVEKVVAGGRGLARVEGAAIFIPFAAPGDRLRVRVMAKRKNHLLGEIEEIIQPGPLRVAAACPVFGRCGGCQLQHLSDSGQREVKLGFVAEALSRIGGISLEGLLQECLPVSPMTHYRRKAGFKVRMVRGEPLLGFHQSQSHRIVNLGSCQILHPTLERLLHPLKTLIAGLDAADRIPQVDVMAGEASVGVVMHLIRPLGAEDQKRCIAFRRDHHVGQFWMQRGRREHLTLLDGDQELHYRLGELSLGFSPGDFIQVNGEGNRNLVHTALEMVGEGGYVWDLFSGIGNFSLPLAQRFKNVLAVEESQAAVKRLKSNAIRADMKHIETLQANLFLEDGLNRLRDAGQPEVVLLDPPRCGAVEWVKRIQEFAPQRILYVSCDPATFSRDAAILVHRGYFVQKVIPVDLFPHTHHVELVALFVRTPDNSME